MTWDLTLLTVHILAAYGCAMLFCAAPSRLQKGVLLLLALSALVLVSVYACDLFAHEYPGIVKLIAYKTEHLAVLLYLFRIVFIERLACKNSFPHSLPFRE